MHMAGNGGQRAETWRRHMVGTHGGQGLEAQRTHGGHMADKVSYPGQSREKADTRWTNDGQTAGKVWWYGQSGHKADTRWTHDGQGLVAWLSRTQGGHMADKHRGQPSST